MQVVFDPAKDAKNIKDHGVSLNRAADFDLDSAMVDVDTRQDYGEIRYHAVGWLDARLYALTFTVPDIDILRAISPVPQPNTSRGNMPKTNKDFSTPTPDNPEWTTEKFARARRAVDIPELQGLLRRGRGPQVKPKKKLVSIRLSADVVDALRASGRGWQSRADGVLRAWVKREQLSSK